MYHMLHAVWVIAGYGAKLDRGLEEISVHVRVRISLLSNMKAASLLFRVRHNVKQVVQPFWHAEGNSPREADVLGFGIVDDEVECWALIPYDFWSLAAESTFQICEA